MSGVDLVKAGLAPAVDRSEADAGERQSVYFKGAFRLQRDDGSIQNFPAGHNDDVLVSDLNHWFVKLHIGEPPAAPLPAGAAPEPRSNVVADTGAPKALEGGEGAAAGPEGLGVANGDLTDEQLKAEALKQNSDALAAAAAAGQQTEQNPPAPPAP